MFYSDTCDDIGPFKMCDSSFENSISSGGGCAYNKKEDTLGTSIPAIILKCMTILNLRGVPFQAAVVFVLGLDFLLAHSVTLRSFPSITNYLNQTVCAKLRSA